MISEEEKTIIREEEIYRQEVRKELSQSRSAIWVFLNSPFGIWVLSTIIVGSLSFMYTQWKDANDRSSENKEALQSIYEEGAFRLNQLVVAADKANDMAVKIENGINSDGKVFGGLVRNFYSSIGVLESTIKLGGITSAPSLDEDRSVIIGSSGYTIRNLPYGKGYKYPKFKYLSLMDLAERAYRLRNDEPMSKLRKENLEKVLKKMSEISKISSYQMIFNDWFSRTQASGKYKKLYGNAYNVYKVQVDNYQKEANSTSDLVKKIHDYLKNSVLANRDIKYFVE